jgi:heme/copper-type cytochrome/quinol oxidase subunit 3
MVTAAAIEHRDEGGAEAREEAGRPRHGGSGPPVGPQAGARPLVSNARLGVAMFIAAEAMFFAGLIGAFVVFRFGSVRWPPVDQPRLPIAVTAVNTAILLFSAFLIHRSKRAIAGGSRGGLESGLLWTAVFGLTFVAIQGSEWARLVHYGLTLSSGTYGATFYTLIGCHGLHVLGAVVWLLAVYGRARRGAFSAADHVGVDVCAMYWYFVVALWPLLFVLVYLR